MGKKKQVPMPKLNFEASVVKKKIFIIAVVASVIVVAGLTALALKTKNVSQTEYVQKNVINNYVCKIVGMDAEAEMIAVECLTK